MTDTTPPTNQQLADIRQRLAAAFEREDAQRWGYDHGFSSDLDQCPETAAFASFSNNTGQPSRSSTPYSRWCSPNSTATPEPSGSGTPGAER